MTISIEDYIKSIYSLSNGSGSGVTTSELSKKLKVSNAAASEMVKKLDSYGYLKHKKYKGVALTQFGKKLALKILRRHRLWELFLTKSLGLTWDKVHREAEVFEHHSSDFLIDKIDEYLNFPSFDPHGHPIPAKNGRIPDLPKLLNLKYAKEKGTYVLKLVDKEEDDLIEFLTFIGLTLNTEFTLVRKVAFDKSYVVKIGKTNHNISEKIATTLFIEKVK